jgi:hypothetical protein
MYSEDRHKSAKHRWDNASSRQKIAMLREAGYPGGMAHAYRKFDDLPTEMKLDLNYVADRELKKKAAEEEEQEVSYA